MSLLRSLLLMSFFWFLCFCKAMGIQINFDQLSGNAKIEYQVPDNFPDIIEVSAKFKLSENDDLQNAAINKYRSATALKIMEKFLILEEQKTGTVLEHFAAGRKRCLIWRTAEQLPVGKTVNGKFYLTISEPENEKKSLVAVEKDFAVDRTEIVLLNKFTENEQIFPEIIASESRDNPGWVEVTGQGLQVVEKEELLEPLCWRPQLNGYYAIYVYVPKTGYGEIELALSTDFFSQRFSAVSGHEYFWKIADMTDCHLIIRQPYRTIFTVGDELKARLGYIKMVPVSKEDYKKYAVNRSVNRDKFVAAYFEPYSWAFREYVAQNSKFIEAMAAYREAMVNLVDSQCGRHGCKLMFPNNREMPMVHITKGDAAPGSNIQPTSLGTGRMVRNTDLIRAGIVAAKAFDLKVFSNFGAANNYRGGLLESDFSKENPDYFIGNYYLDYANPQARRYALNNHRHSLERGARGISIDFCRYPHGLKNKEDGNAFMRELRSLADEYSSNSEKVEILVRIPVPGCKNVRDQFDAETWVKEKLIDYLVPADFSGMPNYDIDAFVAITKNSPVKCLAGIDGLSAGPPMPGEVIRLADKYYNQGADGIYLYQSDAHIVGTMTHAMQINHDLIRTLGHKQLVKEALRKEEEKIKEYSFDVYFHFPSPYQSSRAWFWIEGIQADEVRMYIQDKLITKTSTKPYILGDMGYENHYQFLGKNIKAKIEVDFDNNKTWQREFEIPMVLRAYAF